MANSSLHGSIIHLDTFTAAIDFAQIKPKGMKLQSIEWLQPSSTDHTFTILAGGSSGTPIFKEKCTASGQSVIKYFHGKWLKPLYLAVAAGNEKASGEIIIVLDQD